MLPMLQYFRQSSWLDNKSLSSNLSMIDIVHWEEEEEVFAMFLLSDGLRDAYYGSNTTHDNSVTVAGLMVLYN